MSRKPNRAVLGLLWGDEGKAKIIDLLGKYAEMIVRFQGGANAGHTVMIKDKKTVLHQIPVGIMHDNTICVLGAGMVIDLEGFFQEIKMLEESGINVRDRLFISPRAHLVSTITKKIEQGFEKKNPIGTTCKGIGPTYSEKALRTGLRIGDLVRNRHFDDLVKKQYEIYQPILKEIYEIDLPPFAEVLSDLLKYRNKLKNIVKPCLTMVNNAVRDGDGVLFEGAQGSMLDIDWGTYPYVTSSNTTMGGIVSGSGIDPRKIDQVIGVIKTFTTRVGDGPFPTEMPQKQAALLRGTGENPWDEFGATTGRPRRIGWLDAVVIKHAITISGVDALAITKVDTLDGMEEIKICRSYWVDGFISDEMPPTVVEFAEARPIYDTLPGWSENTRGITKFSDLPENAQNFIKHIETLVEKPIMIVSTGPNRSETIVVKHS